MSDHVVAFPEKLLKTIATRCTIFSLKFTKNRLAAGLSPDPLGELKRSPRPSSRNMGLLMREGEVGRGKGRRDREEERGREGWKGGEGIIHLLLPQAHTAVAAYAVQFVIHLTLGT